MAGTDNLVVEHLCHIRAVDRIDSTVSELRGRVGHLEEQYASHQPARLRSVCCSRPFVSASRRGAALYVGMTTATFRTDKGTLWTAEFGISGRKRIDDLQAPEVQATMHVFAP
jgi:hypothetical protein